MGMKTEAKIWKKIMDTHTTQYTHFKKWHAFYPCMEAVACTLLKGEID